MVDEVEKDSLGLEPVPAPPRSERVERVISDLKDDRERLGGILEERDVERLLVSRKLTPDESIQVYGALRDLEITLSPDLTGDSGNSQESLAGDGDDHRRILSRDEEVALGRALLLGKELSSRGSEECGNDGKKIVARAAEARERLILHNQRLVHSIAKEYGSRTELSLEELGQEGMIGLIKGVERFDYRLGCKFSTYGSWWIRQCIQRAIDDRGRMIRIPVHRVDSIRKYRKALRILGKEIAGGEPTVGQLAERLGWTDEKTILIGELINTEIVPLNAPQGEEKKQSIINILRSDFVSPEQAFQDSQVRRCIDSALNSLKPKEKQILEMRFALNGHLKEHTLEEIGEKFCVTRERIRQIEAKAMEKLIRRADVLGLRKLLED